MGMGEGIRALVCSGIKMFYEVSPVELCHVKNVFVEHSTNEVSRHVNQTIHILIDEL